jgi:hypothetical protein
MVKRPNTDTGPLKPPNNITVVRAIIGNKDLRKNVVTISSSLSGGSSSSFLTPKTFPRPGIFSNNFPPGILRLTESTT